MLEISLRKLTANAYYVYYFIFVGTILQSSEQISGRVHARSRYISPLRSSVTCRSIAAPRQFRYRPVTISSHNVSNGIVYTSLGGDAKNALRKSIDIDIKFQHHCSPSPRHLRPRNGPVPAARKTLDSRIN